MIKPSFSYCSSANLKLYNAAKSLEIDIIKNFSTYLAK